MKDERHKIVGSKRRASMRYAMMQNRLKTASPTVNKGYMGIELRVSREDFIAWFQAGDFVGCSVDRIDPKGHYEIGNMQLIPTWVNAGKDKLISTADGTSRCYVCKKEKPLTDFVKDKRRVLTGYSTLCKPCDTARIKNVSL